MSHYSYIRAKFHFKGQLLHCIHFAAGVICALDSELVCGISISTRVDTGQTYARYNTVICCFILGCHDYHHNNIAH